MRNPGQLFIAGISVLGLSGAPPVVAQDVYKWTDDGGLVNYADIVPPNVTASCWINGFSIIRNTTTGQTARESSIPW